MNEHGPEEQLLHEAARLGVEGAERLVQRSRILGSLARARERRALPHPSRQQSGEEGAVEEGRHVGAELGGLVAGAAEGGAADAEAGLERVDGDVAID